MKAYLFLGSGRLLVSSGHLWLDILPCRLQRNECPITGRILAVVAQIMRSIWPLLIGRCRRFGLTGRWFLVRCGHHTWMSTKWRRHMLRWPLIQIATAVLYERRNIRMMARHGHRMTLHRRMYVCGRSIWMHDWNHVRRRHSRVMYEQRCPSHKRHLTVGQMRRWNGHWMWHECGHLWWQRLRDCR